MTKLIYNPLSDSFDYINKNNDFSISGLKDVEYIHPDDGDSIVWNDSLGKWSSQNITGSPDLDGGVPNSNYNSTTTINGGVP